MNVGLRISVTVNTSTLDALAASLPARVSNALMKGGAMIEGDAKQLAPVDTGALRNSIHTEQTGPFAVVVMDGVSYGIFQELGTYKMRAQPFMVPAVERNADGILGLMKGIFR